MDDHAQDPPRRGDLQPASDRGPGGSGGGRLGRRRVRDRAGGRPGRGKGRLSDPGRGSTAPPPRAADVSGCHRTDPGASPAAPRRPTDNGTGRGKTETDRGKTETDRGKTRRWESCRRACELCRRAKVKRGSDEILDPVN